ncbi:hypothetical protein EVAR_31772_1 [Eumeta japonica]|uniref:Uncharacterized protein n=1 Tax=Eumeta variegata TaxID=151549 RepID=A0A4C1W6Z8_EUMVA|nr:hypothetical protein EVAR_31772_1 [Eumeta japonica]
MTTAKLGTGRDRRGNTSTASAVTPQTPRVSAEDISVVLALERRWLVKARRGRVIRAAPAARRPPPPRAAHRWAARNKRVRCTRRSRCSLYITADVYDDSNAFFVIHCCFD